MQKSENQIWQKAADNLSDRPQNAVQSKKLPPFVKILQFLCRSVTVGDTGMHGRLPAAGHNMSQKHPCRHPHTDLWEGVSLA